MNIRFLLVVATLLAGSLGSAPLRAEDEPGCKDHPLFNRMPGYGLKSCETKDFDARDFPASGALDADNLPLKPETVEGAQTTLVYETTTEGHYASGLQIARNFQNAAKAAGGVVVAEFGADDSGKQLNDPTWGAIDRATVLRFTKGGKDIWAAVLPINSGQSYTLYIGERQAMQQAIVANELLDKLNRDGFVALYINFDTGKATIKPDSVKIVDEIAAMLKGAAALKIEIGGHTDNVGTADANQKLSEARAQSVVAALGQRGVAASRLMAKGYGQSAPVADNRSEDGRSKNRRVELKKL